MQGITSISTALSFDPVRVDEQATDNVQDTANNAVDVPAQGAFFPVLASAMVGLSQQPLDEHDIQADGLGQTCEGLPTAEADAGGAGNAPLASVGATVGIETSEVLSLMSEGQQATLVPLTGKIDSRQHGGFPPMWENALLRREAVAAVGGDLSVLTQTLQTDVNAPPSPEGQSSSSSPVVGRHLANPDEDGIKQVYREQVHRLQPLAEMGEALDTSISTITSESNLGTQIRGEGSQTVSQSARPSEGLSTLVSQLLPGSDGTPRISGAQLHTVSSSVRPSGELGTLSSRPVLEVEGTPQDSGARPDAQASSITVHDGDQRSQIADDPVRTAPSTTRLGGTPSNPNVATNQEKSDTEQMLRAFKASGSVGTEPTLETTDSQSHELSSGGRLNEATQSGILNRPSPATDGVHSTRSANTSPAQQTGRSVHTPTLASIPSSAMLGNGERTFLYQMGKVVTKDAERRNSSEPPKGIEADMTAQTVESRESGSLPELPTDADQTAMSLAGRSAMQPEANSERSQKHVTSADAMNSGWGKVMPQVAGSDAIARDSVISNSQESEVGKRPSVQPVGDGLSGENAKAGGTTSKDGNEKVLGNSHLSSVELKPASATSGPIAAESAPKTSDTNAVDSMSAHAPSMHTSSTPSTAGTKPTGFFAQELGFDARTISSLVTENLTNRISSESLQRLRDGVSELKLQLKPESLGEMTLKVRLDDEKVVAQIHVTQPEVKVALEATMPQLRDALASRGMEVQRIDISTTGDAPARESRGQQETRQRLSARRRGTDGAEERYKGGRSMGYNTLEIIM
jgi:flagellar hook-length control protein FliK